MCNKTSCDVWPEAPCCVNSSLTWHRDIMDNKEDQCAEGATRIRSPKTAQQTVRGRMAPPGGCDSRKVLAWTASSREALMRVWDWPENGLCRCPRCIPIQVKLNPPRPVAQRCEMGSHASQKLRKAMASPLPVTSLLEGPQMIMETRPLLAAVPMGLQEGPKSSSTIPQRPEFAPCLPLRILRPL